MVQSQGAYLRQLFVRLGIAMLGFSVCRVLFWLFNAPAFAPLSPLAFLAGLRFDLSAVLYLFSPVVALHVLPFSFRSGRAYQKILKILFHAANTLALFLNCIDMGYYRFVSRRVSADTWNVLAAGEDFLPLLPRYLLDFWHLWAIFFLLVAFSEALYRRTERIDLARIPSRWPIQAGLCVVAIALMVVGMRGGLQMKPLSIVTAFQYADGRRVPVVLNAPFSVLMTLFENSLPQRTYFPPEERDRLFDPAVSPSPQGSFRPYNVVVLVMESLSREYVGRLNQGRGFTPFLDTLIDRGLLFEHTYANASRSIDAIPAVLSSLPALMDTSFLTSPFAGNRISSLASLLSGHGYATAFFHGGTNGTMHFDAYARSAGFQTYYGRREYGNDADYDGHWGIYDGPFLRYVARTLAKTREPFAAAVLTLSAHHPFTIPPEAAGRFPRGKGPIHASIAYADDALGAFFSAIEGAPWFRNTLFVITADHTSINYERQYNTPLGSLQIPLLFYTPDGTLRGRDPRVAQQIDVLPSVLSFLRHDGPYVAFGRDLFDGRRPPEALHYGNGIYQLTGAAFTLQFDGVRDVGLFHYPSDPWLKRDVRQARPRETEAMRNRLKAIVQSYGERLRENRLVWKGAP